MSAGIVANGGLMSLPNLMKNYMYYYKNICILLANAITWINYSQLL